jgi:hypothetical protein
MSRQARISISLWHCAEALHDGQQSVPYLATMPLEQLHATAWIFWPTLRPSPYSLQRARYRSCSSARDRFRAVHAESCAGGRALAKSSERHAVDSVP